MFVIDVLDALSPRSVAKGTKVAHRQGLPRVGPGFDPKVTVPGGPAPTELVGQVLIRGTGPRLH